MEAIAPIRDAPVKEKIARVENQSGVEDDLLDLLDDEVASEGVQEVKRAQGEGSQAALVNEPLFSSPNSSVTVVVPTAEGEGYKFVAATTFTSSTNVTVNATAGTPTVPPNYSFSVPSTAIVGANTGGLTPVTVSYNAGIFSLGVDAATIGGIIPRTVVVGGSIGATPNAATLAAAVALLPAGPFLITAPWTLLICPGTYSGAAIVLPPNVNIVALERGTVILDQDISMTDATAANGRTIYSGVTLGAGTFAFTTTAKAAASTYQVRLLGCNQVDGFVNASMRAQPTGAPTSGYYRDYLELLDCVFTGGNLNPNSGMTTITSSRIVGANLTLGVSAASTIKRLQISGSVIGPTVLTTFADNNFVSVRDSTLSGTWRTSGVNCVLLMSNCLVDSNQAIPGGQPQWTLRPDNQSKCYIWGTYLPISVAKTSASVYTLNFPNLVPGTGTPGGVDRPFSTVLLDYPSLILGGTINVLLPVPVVTPFHNSPVTNPQAPIQFSQVTGPGTIYVSNTSTLSSFNVFSQISILGNALSIDVRPPAYNGVTWFSS